MNSVHFFTILWIILEFNSQEIAFWALKTSEQSNHQFLEALVLSELDF